MQISGTFLKSKIGRHIALLLFIAAVVPATLMTLLSNNKITQLVTNYEHNSLVQESRTYALTAFSNLVFARSKLEQLVHSDNKTTTAENLSVKYSNVDLNIFNSTVEVAQDGTYLSGNRHQYIPTDTIKALQTGKPDQSKLLVWHSNGAQKRLVTNLALTLTNKQKKQSFLIAELNQSFLWGDKLDYPSGSSVCAYQTINDVKTKLFCSSGEAEKSGYLEQSDLNSASWELFLAGEFGSDPWLFEVNRLHHLTESHLREFVGSKAYIGISVLSLLIIGLLSLIQIRKTMVPLEHLMQGTEKIAEGDFSPINVKGTSEFSELAGAFNSMSSRIKRQLETLKSFSAIDREISTNVDIKLVTDLVMTRMKALLPCGIFCIAYQEEISEQDGQFNCSVTGHESLTSVRLSVSSKEISIIKRYSEGQMKHSSLSSDLSHERLMAELGAEQIWVLPIFWQGELCAFLLAGCKNEFNLNNAKQAIPEFRELANRISVVISAHQREQKLLIEAQYDSLTGLPNRILLQDRLKQAMDHADRTGLPLWVVFIDLDRFKDVNDSLGHATGDALLVELSRRLKEEIRETDTVSRFGGDEFVIVIAGDVNENTQLSVLNRIMNTISQPIHLNNHELQSTCSIGIAAYPNDGKNAEMLIKNADIAMYRAKELGKNNYQFFTQRLNDQAAERMKVISLLRKAIAQNEFTLHYQPKVDLASNQIVGLEALIRWSNPILGNVPPAKFIPMAEEAGLIVEIGDWVLKTACNQLAIWQKSGMGKLLLSVNISAKQFNHPDLIRKIKSTIVEAGIKADCIELELTESLLMNDSNKIISTLHEIRALGVQLSIDDFGTGYSNLSYLHTLPINTLKIDKAFVDNIVLNSAKTPIVNTIIILAKNMGLKVVAEGAESADQVQHLKLHGCDQIQGYYFSKALPANEIKEMIMSGKKLDLPKLELVKNSVKKNIILQDNA